MIRAHLLRLLNRLARRRALRIERIDDMLARAGHRADVVPLRERRRSQSTTVHPNPHWALTDSNERRIVGCTCGFVPADHEAGMEHWLRHHEPKGSVG